MADEPTVNRGPDYHLNLSGRPAGPPPAPVRDPRPWLAVRWRCCSAYSRIYRAPAATQYVGHCPRCGKQVRAQVGEGGVSTRFFEAG